VRVCSCSPAATLDSQEESVTSFVRQSPRNVPSPCNKRQPSSECGVLGGDTLGLAILGTGPRSLANCPGDLAVALAVVDACVATRDLRGIERTIPVKDLHRLPGDRPYIETVLAPHEMITAIHIPMRDHLRSACIKVGDRQSDAFAIVSAAVSLQLDQMVRSRIARSLLAV